ncbi:MAG: hypothetical protein ACF8XB_19335 [Planctomycetota bacterium JB042]
MSSGGTRIGAFVAGALLATGCRAPSGPDAVRIEAPGDPATEREPATDASAGGATRPAPVPDPFASDVSAPPPPAVPRRSPVELLERTFDDSAAGALRIDAAPARAILAAKVRGPRPPALARALDVVAYCTDADRADVEAAFERALSGAGEEDAYFTFHAARHDDRTEARLGRVEEVLAARRDAIESRVRRLLPEVEARVPPLEVWVVLGMPEHRPIAVAPAPDDDRGRVVVVDAWWVGAAETDAAGERLSRRLAQELFYVRHAAVESGRARPASGLARLLSVAMNEGTGRWLALDDAYRFDDQGRRRPSADAAARRAIDRFETNLARLLDPALEEAERRHLEWTLYNAEAGEEPWGTWATALMLDAVDRFEEPERLREVIDGGPSALVATYARIGGRRATVPPLAAETRAQVERISGP